MIFYDTETCGLHGMCVLIQYAYDDGPIQLYNVWDEPVSKTLNLIEEMMDHELCGFNLSFDHFHLCKLYTILRLLPDCSEKPVHNIEEIALLEPKGRDGPCLKPKAACDLFLWARKGKYQSTMARRNIAVRKVPAAICAEVQELLETTVKLDDLYFANRKDIHAPRWSIDDRKDCDDFKDIVLRFKACCKR